MDSTNSFTIFWQKSTLRNMCCQCKDEKGTGAEIVPQLFLGSSLV